MGLKDRIKKRVRKWAEYHVGRLFVGYAQDGGEIPHDEANASMYISGGPNGRAIAIVNVDDEQVTGEGRGNITWWTNMGGQMWALTSHPAHDHFSMYGKDSPTGDGSASLEKRFNMYFPDEDGNPGHASWHNTSFFDYNGADLQDIGTVKTRSGAEHDGNVDMRNNLLERVAGLRFEPDTSQSLVYDLSAGDGRFYDKDAEEDVMQFLGPNRISVEGSRLQDMRNIDGASAADLNDGEVAIDRTNDRIVWKDADGNAFYAGGSTLA